jgi:hypothetical protein
MNQSVVKNSLPNFVRQKKEKKMKTVSKTILLSAVLAVALFTAACPKRTSIRDIERNPSRFYGKDVAVAGNVTNSYGLAMLGGVYKLDDGTGSIWVLTKRSVPSRGTQVGVKGRIQEGVNFSGRNYGLGLIEEDRRVRR